MEINKRLTTVNYKKGNGKQNKYIVVHYVGATGGAEANCRYFQSNYRGSSAHYFIGHAGEVWQCVEDKDIAWHCGASTYKHTDCRNENSISVELCCRKKSDGSWYFEDATVKTAIELTKQLMKKYNIPIGNVIRHYDVTGKTCPEPFVRDAAAWNDFKGELVELKSLDNTPDAYAKEAIEWAIKNDVLKGSNGNYKLHSPITRQEALVFLYRALK
jgi:N-acetyl-anhydromuramyl-L-alanine amidase AmpD